MERVEEIESFFRGYTSKVGVAEVRLGMGIKFSVRW